MAKAKVTIGRLEYIALPKLGVVRVQAKMDTGAYRSALHYQKIALRNVDGHEELAVTFAMGRKRTKMVFKRFSRVVVKTSTGQRTPERPGRRSIVFHSRLKCTDSASLVT